jgi:hypothetical protein
MKLLVFAYTFLVLATSASAEVSVPASEFTAQDGSLFEASDAVGRQLEAGRSEAVSERAFRVQILQSVKSRRAELLTRGLHLQHRQEQWNKEVEEFFKDAIDALPDAFRDSISRDWTGEGAKKVFELAARLSPLSDKQQQLMEAQLDLSTNREQDQELLAKLDGEIADLKNEIAICDSIIAAYDRSIAEHLSQVDSNQQADSPQEGVPQAQMGGRSTGDPSGPEHTFNDVRGGGDRGGDIRGAVENRSGGDTRGGEKLGGGEKRGGETHGGSAPSVEIHPRG